MPFFKKSYDFIAIGDIVTDAFIKLKDAHVTCKVNTEDCEICMKFGDKIPFEFDVVLAGVGNSPNAAVSAARLGLSSALIANVGHDERGQQCKDSLEKNDVSTDYIGMQAGKKSNFHYVLWYGAERTILVKHEDFAYSMPKINPPKWIYLSSMGAASADFHDEISEYLIENPAVKLAFQPGTFQMSLGTGRLRDIYARTEVFAVNVEEAERILDQKAENRDMRKLFEGLHALGPKIVLLTDGPNGAYLSDRSANAGVDSKKIWMMPPYPDPKPPYERTGAGDAFCSTFVAALALGKTPLEALAWAPINSMSVVQYIGAQEGLLTRPALEDWLAKRPKEYLPKEI